MGSQASKRSTQPSAKGLPCRGVGAEAASSSGCADGSWKSGLAKHAGLVAESVDDPIEAHGENVHDDTSVTDGSGNAEKPSGSDGGT